jgi:hypothetical protein
VNCVVVANILWLAIAAWEFHEEQATIESRFVKTAKNCNGVGCALHLPLARRSSAQETQAR